MHDQFGLVLVVNHACNLRCSYCYTGEKFNRSMPLAMGEKAIDRAVASLSAGGTLELAFFGGEPLAEAAHIQSWIDYARSAVAKADCRLSMTMTSNGTITTPPAWAILNNPDIELCISHDGLPEVHDRHRQGVDGRGTSGAVLATIRRLLERGRQVRVIMVVRPPTVAALADGIEFLWEAGVREFEPSLDLWTTWTFADVDRLCQAVKRCARIWQSHLPKIAIGWFDEKAAALTNAPMRPSARCGFGAGEVAVSPAGNLYPCERLVGSDDDGNPMRLPGHCLKGDEFLRLSASPGRDDPGCLQCTLQGVCNTVCRCSNYIRTGRATRPDRLLCDFNQACIDAVAELFQPEDSAATRTPLHVVSQAELTR